ncbi:DNA polymerase I [Pantoea sp. Aalb]|uniref:DNA polymerase I n=1 Tax=Pantoea sp. Aalb TaxID=2576762 RepID=UPI0013245B99|nr:DNA polymerase I [Pantoea sp. Aalb]MXP67960.1 DNA polymerase I [Pantoea sp. Aalb]
MAQIITNPLILIDGSSYLYRAYYAFPSLMNSLGKPTGAMYGILSMIKSLLMQYNTSHVVVVFDSQGKTFRNDLFKQYKAHRPPMPNSLIIQLQPIHAMLKAMGLPILQIHGVEADDVIGTLALEAEKKGQEVLISSNDKDMAQLVSSRIKLINSITHTILGPKEVEQKYGVPPSLIIDFIAMMGDSSDSIPGIPGIGQKTAKTMLQSFGNMYSIYNNLDKINKLSFRGAKTVATKLKANRDIAFMSYKLAKIKTDVELKISSNQLILKEPDFDTLKDLFYYYEFNIWLKDIQKGKWIKKNKDTQEQKNLSPNKGKIIKTTISTSYRNYNLISNQTMLNDLIEKLKNANVFSLSLETDSVDTLIANIIGIAFSIKSGESTYLPIYHDFSKKINKLHCVKILKQLKPLLEDNRIFKIGKNLKYYRGVLNNYGIELNGIKFDTMLESYCLNSTKGKHDIVNLAEYWLSRKIITIKEIIDKKKNKIYLEKIDFEKVAISTSEDADINLQIHLQIWPKLKIQEGPKKIFEEIEIPLLKVISRIERNGVLIDRLLLEQYSQEISIRLAQLKQEAYELTGKSFNLSSTKQLQVILFNNKNTHLTRKTPSGATSTSEAVLEKLALHYPLPKIILKHRSLLKLKSTYIDKLLLMLHPITGRIHTSYNQTVTATGRLSSTTPNLQNIPIRNNEGRSIRQAFIAGSYKRIITADYSQIELRIMAHISQDKQLLYAFACGNDIHSITASEIFGISLAKVSSHQRRSAKAINFGLIYGMSPFGLARELNISTSEAKKYIDVYFMRYPGVLRYMQETREKAKKKGYVETLEGRRLWLPNIKSHNATQRKASERAAINAPLQGTAADIIKKAMIAIDEWLQQQCIDDIKMIMQVHDELVFEISENIVEFSIKKICNLMENIMQLDVPLLVTIGNGKNWEQAYSKI